MNFYDFFEIRAKIKFEVNRFETLIAPIDIPNEINEQFSIVLNLMNKYIDELEKLAFEEN